MAETTLLTTVRRTRRAYIGAHVMAFEFAKKRAALRLDQLKNFGSNLVSRGETVEDSAMDALETAKEKVADIVPSKAEAKTTIDVKPTRVAKKLKPAKPADLSTDITPKPTTKSQPKTPSKNEAAQEGVILDEKYTSHLESVAKYDADANPVTIKKIVDHLGIALESRDSMFVACSDPSERETVAKSWLMKTLGVEADTDALDAKVMATCDEMKDDRMKPRVTFYYLLAKAEGKLGEI